MCAVIGYIGNFSEMFLDKLIYESEIRGLHYLGKEIRSNAGIIHCRYCTSGEDNQPIEYLGTYLAFNGVIDMGTKEEMETKYQIKMHTDNDGEVFVKKTFTEEKRMVEFIKNSSVTFAGVILQFNQLIALRNNGRPLWKKEEDGTVLIASTNDIFKRCGIFDAEQLQPFRIYKWTF